MLRLLVTGLLAVALPCTALAAAIVESMKGDVQVGGVPVPQGRRVLPYTAITTGQGSQVFLKFDDGTQIMLGENSVMRFHDYRYTPSASSSDRAVFELLRGSARVVTGRIAAANPKEFFFRTPQTEFTVDRGADFTVALVNPAYVTVHRGAVISNNGWGTPVTLNAGSTSVIASNAANAVPIAASQLPPSAAAAMGNLSVAAVTAPAGGPAGGAAGVAAGAAQEVGRWVILGIVAAGALAIIAAQNDDDPTPTTPSH